MAKLFEVLKIAISNQENSIFLWIVFFYIVLLLIDVSTYKKVPFTGSALLLSLGLFTVFYLVSRDKIPNSVITFLTKNFTTVKMAVLNILVYFLTFTALIYIWKINQLKNRHAFIIRAYQDVPFEMMFIADSNARVIYETPYGLNCFDSKHSIKDSINKDIKGMSINDKKIDKNLFLSTLNSSKDLTSFKFTLVKNSGEEKTFNLVKKNIEINNEYFGFVLYHEDELKEVIDSVSFIDAFDEPLAYFDSSINKYLINKKMVKLLQLNTSLLSMDEFKFYIHPSDLDLFNQNLSALDNGKKNIFRINVKNNTYWFDASLNNNDGSVLIRRTSSINQRNKLVFKTHNDLANDIEQFQSENREYGLLTISFSNLVKHNFKEGKDLSSTLISYYFKSLFDGPYKDEIEVYQLGNIEFGILVKNHTTFDIITREIVEERSNIFKEASFVINNENIKIDLAVGIVSSKNIEESSATEVINFSYEALQEALDPKYPNNYSIFHQKTSFVKEYRLEDFDIDLSERFLEKFKL